MPLVAAVQLGDPFTTLVLVVSDDHALHATRVRGCPQTTRGPCGPRGGCGNPLVRVGAGLESGQSM